MICDKCKKFFMSGNRPDGIPNGVKMLLKGGKSVTICADCMVKLGAMKTEAEKDAFINSLKDGKADE